MSHGGFLVLHDDCRGQDYGVDGRAVEQGLNIFIFVLAYQACVAGVVCMGGHTEEILSFDRYGLLYGRANLNETFRD